MSSSISSRGKRTIRRVKNGSLVDIDIIEKVEQYEEISEETLPTKSSLAVRAASTNNVFDENINELVNLANMYNNKLSEIDACTESIDELGMKKIAIESAIRSKENILEESREAMNLIEKNRSQIVKRFKRRKFLDRLDFGTRREMKRLTAKIQKLNDSITGLNGKSSKLDYQLLNIRNLVDDKTAELHVSQTESDKLNDTIANNQSEMISLKNKIVALSDEVNDEAKDLTLKKVEMNKLDLDVKIITTEIEKIKKEHSDKMRRHEYAFEKEMESANKKYRDLKNKYDKIVEEKKYIVNSTNKKKEILFNKRNLKSGFDELVEKGNEKVDFEKDLLENKYRQISQKEVDIKKLKQSKKAN